MDSERRKDLELDEPREAGTRTLAGPELAGAGSEKRVKLEIEREKSLGEIVARIVEGLRK